MPRIKNGKERNVDEYTIVFVWFSVKEITLDMEKPEGDSKIKIITCMNCRDFSKYKWRELRINRANFILYHYSIDSYICLLFLTNYKSLKKKN